MSKMSAEKKGKIHDIIFGSLNSVFANIFQIPGLLQGLTGDRAFSRFLIFFARIFTLFKKRKALFVFLNRAKPRCLRYMFGKFSKGRLE